VPCGLTVTQSYKLESLQKRALRIIHQIVCDMPYESACAFAGVQPVSARRYELGRRFFRSITQFDSFIHDLLPQRRDSEILSRLRRHLLFTMPWLNISNKINKRSLTALYIDVCNDCLRRVVVQIIRLFANIGLFTAFLVCVRFTVFLKFFVHALHCLSFSYSATVFEQT